MTLTRPSALTASLVIGVSLVALGVAGPLLDALGSPATPADPSGTIAYVSSTDRILLVEADGKRPRALMRPSGKYADSQLVWSPAGDMIAFVRQLTAVYWNRDSETPALYALFVARADGSKMRRLTKPRTGMTSSVSWSPDGTRILYDRWSLERGATPAIHLVDVETRRERRLTPPTVRWSTAPAWSPDGRRIVFVSSSRRGVSELRTMNSDGTRVRTLLRAAAALTTPQWSPDGRTISFGKGRTDLTGWFEIHVVNRDGSGRRRLADRVGYEGLHAWSPVGSRLSFGGATANGLYEVFVIDTVHSTKRRLTRNATLELPDLAWSPDGQWLAYAATSPEGDSPAVGIYAIRWDGSRLQKVTADGHGPAWRPGPP